MGMKSTIFITSSVLSLAAGFLAHADQKIPAAQQCVTSTDSACTGTATVGVSIPIPSKNVKKRIAGECEMSVVGEKGFRPCSDIKLVARSVQENEVRDAVFDGKTFRFEDLNHPTYKLEAVSQKYEVSTDTKVLNPGQNVKIRVKVKPRP